MSQIAKGRIEASHRDAAISDADYQSYLDRLARHPAMSDANTRFSGGTKAISAALGAIGLLGLIVWLLGFTVVPYKHGIGSFMVGTFSVLAPAIGCLFFIMIWYMFNAQWPTSIRRIFENVAAAIWVPLAGMGVILIAELAFGQNLEKGGIFPWMAIDPADNYLIGKKEPWLNEPFLIVRFVIYAAVWTYLASRMLGLSLEMDKTGNRWLKRTARQTSGWGLLALALTSAFAAYDFLMALDYRFFSTMWGVYYFASSMLAAAAVGANIVGVCRLRGKLTELVTKEHLHDLGKLMFAFTVFWAYIAFSQYFLIWYANIPEETFWFIYRNQNGWFEMGVFLCVGHFIVPFLILLVRKVKETTPLLMLMGVWMLFVTVMDMLYIIRPMSYAGIGAPEPAGPTTWWVDLAAIVGCFGLFGAVVARNLGSKPLVPMQDPQMEECLHHTNPI